MNTCHQPKFKSRTILVLLSLMFGNAFAKDQLGNITLIGKVPGRYLSGKSKSSAYLSKVVIKKGVIKEVKEISESDIAKIKSSSKDAVITLKNDSGKFDVIYPGLVDLHNHTKQNILPLWDAAHGQFANRFEWRGWNKYEEAVSQNVNPWIKDYGKVVSCAAFRWSELQAMVLGTTYLQGPSSCVSDFAIHHVEGGDGFLYDKTDAKGEPVVELDNVSAPTDIVDPGTFTFLWETVKPKVDKGASFAKGLESVFYAYCPSLKTSVQSAFDASTKKLQAAIKSAETKYNKKKDGKNLKSLESARYSLNRELMLDKEVIKIVTNKAKLQKSCSNYHDKFLRYMSFFHSTIAGKLNYINDPHRSSIIAHLSEGRRLDPYNQIEFELLKLIGLDQKYFNLVHAVGINKKGLQHMGKKGMGMIWSPFSNLLLYGETADILEAHKAGVKIALGSDWSPTGSKSVLEELKIARNYVKKLGISNIFDDEYLYKMVTENSAEVINHAENDANDGIHGIGKVVPDAVGSLIVVTEKEKDPQTNLVLAESGDIALVIIAGKPLYGNTDYLKDYDRSVEYEVLPRYFSELNDLIKKDSKGKPIGPSDDLPTPLHGEELKQEAAHRAQSSLGIVDSFKANVRKGETESQALTHALESKNKTKAQYTKALSAANKEIDTENKESFAKILITVASSKHLKDMRGKDDCGFTQEKGFVYQDSLKSNVGSRGEAQDDIISLKEKTGLNLDRAYDLQKFLGALMLTQSKNILGIGNPKGAISYMPDLFSCNDQKYSERFNAFVSKNKSERDEYLENKDYRIEFRKSAQDSIDRYNATHSAKPRTSAAEQMALDYGLKYDSKEGVYGY